MPNLSRHNLTRASRVMQGSAANGSYEGGKNGVEVTQTYWWKPTGKSTLTFTGVLAAGAVGGTLNAVFAPPAGFYPLTLSTGQIVMIYGIQGSTAATFWNPLQLVGNPTAASVQTAATATATMTGTPPIVGVAAGYSASASVGLGGLAVLGGANTGATTVNGIAYAAAGLPDVPRNVVGAWTGASIVTVVGFDVYGQPMSEVSASGTVLTGKKAFAVVTSITSSAAITLATFGFGNVLGFPFAVQSGDFSGAMFNDAADAGTFVQRDLTNPATSSTGDTRGTYVPAGTLNGAKFLVIDFRAMDLSAQVGAFGMQPA
jgi:hypothetical protein